MSLKDLKFNAADFSSKDISSLPDRPSTAGITAEQLKARFDLIPKMMIALGGFNDLIDALVEQGAGDIGVDQIPGLDAETVQRALELLNDNVNEAAKKFTTDNTLTFENNHLSVNVAGSIDENNNLPVSAAAVYETVGNIDLLLKEI